MRFVKFYSQKLGRESRTGNRRIWLESSKLEEVGFEPGSPIAVEVKKRKVVITLSPLGERIVSRRRDRPVLDISNRAISDAFEGVERVIVRIARGEIIIEPLAEELRQEKARRKQRRTRPTFLEVFAGGGTLTRSLRDAGFRPVGAVEIEDRYLENLEYNFPEVVTYCSPVEDIDPRDLPDADLIVAGIPCEAYSVSGISKRNSLGQENKESHPTGHLGFYVLKIIDAIRPAAVLIEEVPGFGKSAIAVLVRSVLSHMGYTLREDEVRGDEFGGLTKRPRYCMVATMEGAFSFESAKRRVPATLFPRRVGDILEMDENSRAWEDERSNRSIATMKRREAMHRSKGNGFRMGSVTSEDTLCPTITKGHAKIRLTDPILTDGKGHYSFFTARELARINGLPDDYEIPRGRALACEIIGQGVCYDTFRAIGEELHSMFARKRPARRVAA